MVTNTLESLTRRSPAASPASPNAPGAPGAPGAVGAATPAAPRTIVPPPRRRWATRLLLPTAILAATAALLAFAARDALFAATSVEVVRVIAKPVEVTGEADAGGAGAIVAQAPGWVEPDPYPLFVSALTGGIVREVLVLEGQPVAKKDVVARLVDDDAKLALRRAEAEVARRKAQFDAAQTEWANPVSRQRMVAVASAMIEETKAELHTADAMIVEQKAKLAETQAGYDRIRNLGAGAASALDIEQAKFKVQAQAAAVESATRQRAVAAAKQARAEAEHVAAKRELELRIAERKELDTASAELADAEAALEEAKLRLARMEVVSAFDGLVMTRIAGPGTRVMLEGGDADASHIVHLYDPKHLQVRADVPLGDAAKVGVGQRAQVVVDVLPDRIFSAKVTRVVHQADIGKNTLQVKVAIENPTADLKPEMLARVKFFALSRRESNDAVKRTELRVFVPNDALGSNPAPAPGGESAVWLVDGATARARRQLVRLGAAADGWTQVVSGLNPGDVLIVRPPASLREGSRVRTAEAAPASSPAGPFQTQPKVGSPHDKHR